MSDIPNVQDIVSDLANPIATLFDDVPESTVSPDDIGEGFIDFPEDSTEPQPEKVEKDEKEKEPEPAKEPAKDEKPAPETEDKEKGEEELVIDEEPLVDSFVAALEDAWDWEIPEEDRPKTYAEFVKFFEDVVEKSSKPQYANDDVKAFDEFIKAGGSKEGFFSTYNKQLELDHVDPKNETQQTEVLMEFYKNKGFSEEKAKRYIERMRLDESIEQETIDAIDDLKQLRQKEHQANIERQKEIEQAQKESADRFVNDVSTKLKSIQNVFGIDITTKERSNLEAYVFEVGKDGKTQQQRDFEADPVLYTIMTGFAFQNKEKLLTKIEKKAYSAANQRQKERLQELAQKNKTKSDYQIPAADQNDFLDKIFKE